MFRRRIPLRQESFRSLRNWIYGDRWTMNKKGDVPVRNRKRPFLSCKPGRKFVCKVEEQITGILEKKLFLRLCQGIKFDSSILSVHFSPSSKLNCITFEVMLWLQMKTKMKACFEVTLQLPMNSEHVLRLWDSFQCISSFLRGYVTTFNEYSAWPCYTSPETKRPNLFTVHPNASEQNWSSYLQFLLSFAVFSTSTRAIGLSIHTGLHIDSSYACSVATSRSSSSRLPIDPRRCF